MTLYVILYLITLVLFGISVAQVKSFKVIIFIGITTALLILSTHLLSKNTIIEQNDEELIEVVSHQLEFEDSVYNYIKELNIKHPEIVLKQARLESGNFQSEVFKNNNNMFGFKQAYKRPNTQIGTNRGYAVYEDWKQCVIDYALYQTYSAKNMTKEEYINFLNKNFAEDNNYKDKLQ